MCFDRVDHTYDAALKNYCQAYQKNVGALTGGDHDMIARRAGNHIGFFLTWIIRRGFEGEIHRELSQVLKQVKTGELPGVDFFLKYCDGKFWDEDVCPAVLPFVESYLRRRSILERLCKLGAQRPVRPASGVCGRLGGLPPV